MTPDELTEQHTRSYLTTGSDSVKPMFMAVPGESDLPGNLAATHCLERALASSHPTPSATSVYRYYDINGLLLYVGVTSRGISRNREHNGDKEWWRFVHRQELEHYTTRAEALERERDLILSHRPPFNKIHNPTHEPTRAAYLAFAADGQETHDQIVARYSNELPLHLADRGNKWVWLRTDLGCWPVADRITRWEFAKATIPTRKGQSGSVRIHAVEKRFPFAYLRFTREVPQDIFTRAIMKVRWSPSIKPAGYDIRAVQVFVDRGRA